MPRKEEILASFDDAWSDPIRESLTLALNGVTEEAAAYQHPNARGLAIANTPAASTPFFHASPSGR